MLLIVACLFIFAAKFWLYQELAFSPPLQYFAWVSYTLLFILFAVGFSHLVSPQACGKISLLPHKKPYLFFQDKNKNLV